MMGKIRPRVLAGALIGFGLAGVIGLPGALAHKVKHTPGQRDLEKKGRRLMTAARSLGRKRISITVVTPERSTQKY